MCCTFLSEGQQSPGVLGQKSRKLRCEIFYRRKRSVGIVVYVQKKRRREPRDTGLRGLGRIGKKIKEVRENERKARVMDSARFHVKMKKNSLD